MVYPIIAYGDPVLRKKAQEIEEDYPELKQIIADMWETMYHSNGVGLAAPQIGKSIRVFIVDASAFEDEEPEAKGFKKVFINPIIIEETGEKWDFDEGCLSIPKIREDVNRHSDVTIEYYDEKFNLIEETYTGMPARIIQHEYDHLEGILFIDRIHPLKRKQIAGRLTDISRGKVKTDYKMKFPIKR